MLEFGSKRLARQSVKSLQCQVLDIRLEWATYKKTGLSARAFVLVIATVVCNSHFGLMRLPGAAEIVEVLFELGDPALRVDKLIDWCDAQGVLIIDH